MFILFFTEENLVSFLCCSFAKVFSSHFTVQGCSICTYPLHVLVPGVSPQLYVSLCFMCRWWCCLSHESSKIHQEHAWDLRPGVWWKGTVLVNPGGNWFSMVWLLVFISWWLKGKVQPNGSPSLSMSNTWPLSSLWNPSTNLALVFELWRHPSSDVLTSAISSITVRLKEGWSVLFLPIQVQRTCPLPLYSHILIIYTHTMTLTLTDSKTISAHDIPAHDNTPPYQVWL